MSGETWPQEVRALQPLIAGQDSDGDWWILRRYRPIIATSVFSWECLVLLVDRTGNITEDSAESPSESVYRTFEEAWGKMDQWTVADVY